MKTKRKRQRYLQQLAMAARWQLTPAEAQTTLDDYEEIVACSPYSDDEMPGELGTPWQAAKLLAEPRHYRRWLAVFALLSAALFLPALSLMAPMYRLWDLFTMKRSSFSLTILLFLGLSLSFLWFQRTGVRKAGHTLPKGLLPFLLGLLAGTLFVWAVIFLLLFRSQGLNVFAQQMQASGLSFLPHPAQILKELLMIFCVFCAAAGEYGLIQARLTDRRWRSVYVLGLSSCILCIAILAVLVSMNLDFSPGWQQPYLQSYLFVSLTGLAGTGASLC